MNFSILAILFAFTGYLIMRRLKKHFAEFYLENKWLLSSATMGLSMPLLVRGIVDNIRGFSQRFDDHVEQQQALYNCLLFVMADVVPIAF